VPGGTGGPHDGDFFRVGNALLHDPVEAVEQVVVHFARPLAIAGVEELFAVSRGTTEVHLQHRVTAVRQPLRNIVVPPRITAPGTAVDEEHRRQVLGGHPYRGCQVAVDGEPIARLVGDRLHGRQR
jgi:hypothetical protein